MKKIISLLSLICVASLTFISCGDDNNGGGSEVVANLPTPIYQDEAKKIKITSDDSRIKSIEMTEAGDYIIEWKEAAPRNVRGVKYADSNSTFTFGKFTIEGDLYKLAGFGLLDIFQNGLNIDLNITPEDGSEAYTLNGQEDNSGNSPSLMTNNLCRTWKVETTQITVLYDGINVGYRNSGFDLYGIVTYLKGKGIKMNDNFTEGKQVAKVYFTFAGTYCISYEDGSADYGTWSLNDTNFDYLWSAADMGNSLEEGKANISFEGNKLVLTIRAKFTYEGTTYDSTAKQWLVQA